MSILKTRPAIDNAATREAIAIQAAALDAETMRLAQLVADHHVISVATAHKEIAAAFFTRINSQLPGALLDADARAAQWRVRVRLYDKGNPDEPEADTDPDASPDAPGSIVIAGLPEVAVYLGSVAVEFHGQQCPGLDHATLLHRLKSLRPTLSRRGGNAVWRVPYSTLERAWIARVDVERVKAARAET